MSELRLNIRDRNSAIHGEVHGGIADAVIAALSAEPETIAELEAALNRFIKATEGARPLASFREGVNREPWDAGIVIVDIAARMVGAELSDWALLAEGEMEYQDGFESSGVWLPYRVPDEWLFLDSMLEYDARREARQAEYDIPPLDARVVLYGPQMIEFLVNGCLAAREARAEDPVAEVHADWLMTPRADWGGRWPRPVLREKKTFFDFDLQFRATQWSFLGEGPPPLGRETFAYRFAGFGTHEWVIYYDMFRHLLNSCLEQVQSKEPVEA